MTFPALLSLPDDPVISAHHAAVRLYLKLLGILDFNEPRDVKAWGLAEFLRVEPRTVYGCLTMLVRRGYLIDHGRRNGRKNMPRRFTLAWSCEAGRVPERTMPKDDARDEGVMLPHVGGQG